MQTVVKLQCSCITIYIIQIAQFDFLSVSRATIAYTQSKARLWLVHFIP